MTDQLPVNALDPAGATNVTISARHDNAVAVYWDGALLDSRPDTEVGTLTTVVPSADASAGTHTLAVMCKDDSATGTDFAYIDAQVTARILGGGS